jgi:hypothetical protein
MTDQQPPTESADASTDKVSMNEIDISTTEQ